MWRCPDCERTFGRRGAGHVCAPAMSLDEWLATAPPHERPVAERVIAVVADLPDAWIEPVQVGLFLKRRSSFAQLRTMTRWSALSLKLPREVAHPRPSRAIQRQGSRHFHVYNLAIPEDLTGEIADLLVEAYEADAPGR